jgi:hypothetical protein
METAPSPTRPTPLFVVPRAELDEQGALQAEAPESQGRAWINGVEVGGADARFAHLGRSYD